MTTTIIACVCGGVLEAGLVAALLSSPIVIGCIACVKHHAKRFFKKDDDCPCECHDHED
jgi:hypothetical protein